MNCIRAGFFLFITLICSTCKSASIGEIQYTGELAPGREVALDIEVSSSEPVRYRWNSLDGGEFDLLERQNPKFTVPQKELVRIECLVSIGNNPPITKTLSLVVPIQNAAVVETPQYIATPDNGAGPIDILKAGFVPSGWMGDGESGRKFITPVLNSPDDLNVHPNCQKWSYKPGPVGWAAIAFQFPANNWGARPGKNFSRRGFTKVSFWARGIATTGAMPVVEFKAGGGTDASRPHQDSFAVQNDAVTLTLEWKQYQLNLRNQDLSNVVTGFIFAVSTAENPNGATFYLADVTFQ